MRSERYARLRAGIQAGLLASVILGFVIWLFGYITGYRLLTSLMCIFSAGLGLISGAQVYISNPEERAQRDEVLAELEQKSQEKALGRSGKLTSKGRRG